MGMDAMMMEVMMNETLFPELREDSQFRIERLQILNWGTFNGCFDVPVARKGHYIAGNSGSGKSTLLDALTQLLVPPRFVTFNAAAQDAGGRGDRSLLSYVRGYWRSLDSSDDYCCRPKATLSGLALTLRNSAESVTLVQFFWVKEHEVQVGASNRLFGIVDGDFELEPAARDLNEDLDSRRFKKANPEVKYFDWFEHYCSAFRLRFGMESELPLVLLSKAQSAKNLDDLNDFMRRFVLDEPETFAVADRIVEEHADLKKTHDAAVRVKRQVEILTHAKDAVDQYDCAKSCVDGMNRLLKDVLPVYGAVQEQRFLEEKEQALVHEIKRLKDEQEELGKTIDRLQDEHGRLLERKLNLGGNRLAELEREQKRLNDEISRIKRARMELETLLQRLECDVPGDAESFNELMKELEKRAGDDDESAEGLRDEWDDLVVSMGKVRDRKEDVEKEIASLKAGNGALPPELLDFRDRLAATVGVSARRLLYGAECIEVPPESQEFRGEIERVLRDFGMTLLVPEDVFEAVVRVVDEESFGVLVRLVRVDEGRVGADLSESGRGVCSKIRVIDGPHEGFLKHQLVEHYGHICLEDAGGLAPHSCAITRKGLIKSDRLFHEKDDSYAPDDPRHWILGTDCAAKMEALSEEYSRLTGKEKELNEKQSVLSKNEKRLRKSAETCRSVCRYEWKEVNPIPVEERRHEVVRELESIKKNNQDLKTVEGEISRVCGELRKENEKKAEAGVNLGACNKSLVECRRRLKDVESEFGPRLSTFSQEEAEPLLKFDKSSTAKVTFKSLPGHLNTIKGAIGDAIKKQEILAMEQRGVAEKWFTKFTTEFPGDSLDLAGDFAYAPEFMKLLEKLQSQGVHNYVEEFREMLLKKSFENFSELKTMIQDHVLDFREKIDEVNEGLSGVPFNIREGKPSYLRIALSIRSGLVDYQEFSNDLKVALNWNLSEDLSFEELEMKYQRLSRIVDRLEDRPENAVYRRNVLDVRQHVEFNGQEFDEKGGLLEVYRGGAGKSGGQRQKLTVFCLAAAFRYQLCGMERDWPKFAPVILDEAFAKADATFSELAMNVFTKFGFQLIVASPFNVKTRLERYIGGVTIVDNKDGKTSRIAVISDIRKCDEDGLEEAEDEDL